MMRINKSKILLKSIAAIFMGAMLFSCENDMKKVKEITNTDINTDNKITELNMVYTDSGIVKLRLLAPIAIIHEGEEKPFREFPEGLEVFFYKDRDTVVENYIKSDYGISWGKEKLAELKGNVIVVNTDGDTIKTEQAFWDSKKKIIYSDKQVRIIQENQEIIGKDGFEADESFSYYTILNSSGDINVDNDEGK
ncbi:MAG: LPS export ABC transporter periplasmic protein LptC [Ichthyobacteriaceae bacterium]|nr:LPS export ABC transporter periplasmic protein LptC [Ichthyobacteriaceae bacterium]